MAKKKITVDGLSIRIDKIDQNDYICLTDIAKNSSDGKPAFLIQNWMKNMNTVRFLLAWERLHNPEIKVVQMEYLLGTVSDNRFILSPQKWISKYNAIGMLQKAGRGGGTYAHSDIALEFCSWLSPEFKVLILKEFQRLKEDEAQRKNFEWHITKITDNVEEIRNLLDTIPGQLPERNRILGLMDDDE
jgi:hypothetical protein